MVAFTPRLSWLELPDGVRAAISAAVAETCGARVMAATSLNGGFSPGAALRLDLDDGTSVFVKTTSASLNPDSPVLYRREQVVAEHLPASVPAPRLLTHVEHGDWIALVFEFVPGRLAHFPWTAGDWTATARAFERLAAATTPAEERPDPGDSLLGIPELIPVAYLVDEDFGGWGRLAAQPSTTLDGLPDLGDLVGPGDIVELDRLASAALQRLYAAPSEALLHLDVRPDNLLIGDDGAARIVDWPWAASGPAWVDTLMALISVRHGEDLGQDQRRGQDPDRGQGEGQAVSAAVELATLPLTRDLDDDLVTGFLAGWAGYFLDKARLPAPPGLPTLREFQRSQGLATLGWVRDRLSVEVPTP